MSGEWLERHPAPWETVVAPCACCGQVVARRLWVVEVEGASLRFCGPACEQLYREYVLPRRSSQAEGS